MLARAHRVLRGVDYREAVRRGRRVRQQHTVYYIRSRRDHGPARFGFIVSRAVGTAVVRNRVRRRLKAACYSHLPSVSPGTDIVIRALPGSVHAAWTTLQEEIFRAVSKGGVRL